MKRLLLLLVILVGCQSGVDTSDEAGVTAVSVRQFDTSDEAGITAAFEHYTGEEWDERGLCHDEVTELDVVLYAEFAHDLGCEWQWLLLAGEHFGDVADMRADVFAHNGWEDEGNRASIVETWVREVRAGEADVMDRPNELFERRDYAFEPFSAELQPDGSVIVRYWREFDGSDEPLSSFSLNQLLFSADGSTVERSREASFSVYFDLVDDVDDLMQGEWRFEEVVDEDFSSSQTYRFEWGKFFYDAYPPISEQGSYILFEGEDGGISAELHAESLPDEVWRTIVIEPLDDQLLIDGKPFIKLEDTSE